MSNIFTDSKYTKWYNSIIAKAQSRKDSPQYFEVHHIIPECLHEHRVRPGPKGVVSGFPDDPSNLVKLTLEEHYVCHLLLVKMVISTRQRTQLFHALTMMSKTRQSMGMRFNRHLYALLKKNIKLEKRSVFYNKELDKEIRVFEGEEVPDGYTRCGRPKSEEHKKNIGKANTGKGGAARAVAGKGRKHFVNTQTNEAIFIRPEDLPEGDWENTTSFKGTKRETLDIYHHPETHKNIHIYDEADIPEGYVKGRYMTEKQRVSCSLCGKANVAKMGEANKGTRKYHHPSTLHEINAGENDDIPEGYIKGRSPKNIRSGHTQTDKQKTAAREANQKQYTVEFADGIVETFQGMNAVLKRFNTTKPKLFYSIQIGKSAEKYGVLSICVVP